MVKKFVEVTANFTEDGDLIPLAITWEDGAIYEIDRVITKCRAASLKAGGMGVRYTVQINGRAKYLYYEEPRWFVEAK